MILCNVRQFVDGPVNGEDSPHSCCHFLMYRGNYWPPSIMITIVWSALKTSVTFWASRSTAGELYIVVHDGYSQLQQHRSFANRMEAQKIWLPNN